MNKIANVCLCFIYVSVTFCLDYYEPANWERFRKPTQQRYIDIYTNHPDRATVLKEYENIRSSRKYLYPKSTIERSSYVTETYNNNYRKNVPNDLIKFNSDKISTYDGLQSDYGDFTDDLAVAETNNGGFMGFRGYSRKARPKFHTKNHTDEYLNYMPKIPNFHDFNQSDKENINTKVHDLFKKYLARLYKKRYQNVIGGDDSYEELADLSAETGSSDKDIEVFDESEDTSAAHNNYINEIPFHELHFNKSKFLDLSKLMELKNSTKYLAKKFLSLFTIVQFPNTRCVGADTINYYEGTCYYQTECDNLNGTAMGSCANGYGVCCVFIGTCGQSTNQNCSYFQSPNYPNYYPWNGTVLPPLPPPQTNQTIDPRFRYQLMMFLARQESTTTSLSCIFQVTKRSNSVTQLRVDFLDLELRGPVNGTCSAERLLITGQNINDIVPTICGYNNGQHMYIDVSQTSGPIQFAVLSTTVERKRFRIRVCQLSGCANQPNCLQSYTGVQGAISSFNYDQASSLSRSTPGYFNNLNYAICIRKEAGFCSITYTTAGNGSVYPFQINNVDAAGLTTVPPGQAGAEIFSCPDDYLIVNGIRLCGERFNDGSVVQDFTRNAPVTDTGAGPIVIPIRTNANVTGRGFRLFYVQNRCPNS